MSTTPHSTDFGILAVKLPRGQDDVLKGDLGIVSTWIVR